VLQTVYSLGLSGNVPINHRIHRINKVTSHEGESRDTVTIIFYITKNYVTTVSNSSTKFQV
jgi:hypothetical protein